MNMTNKQIVDFAQSNPLCAIPGAIGLEKPEGTPAHWAQYTGRRIFLAATDAAEDGRGDEEYSPNPKRRVRQQVAVRQDELAGLADADRALIPALYLKTKTRSASELKEFIVNRGRAASIVNGVVVGAQLPEEVEAVLDFFDRPRSNFMEWVGFCTTRSLVLDKTVEKLLDSATDEVIFSVARLLGIVA